jgi:D-alanyl-D-alanine endopeptidase (penicillin-binding protein 7)
MIKTTAGLLLSLFALAFIAPNAVAESGPSAKKAAAKKATPLKRKHRAAKGASFDERENLVKKTVIVRGKTKVVYTRVASRPVVPAVPPVVTAGDLAGLNLVRDPLALASNVALVIDQSSSQVLFEKNSKIALPMASITKLMTGLIVVEARQDMEEILEISDEDVDREKNSSSRLRVGSRLSRAEMLHIALMSSENRAASALGRHYPGGKPAFVAAMNAKAKVLGMHETIYFDTTGLSSRNVASARDLAKLVIAAHEQPILCDYTTYHEYVVNPGGRPLQYRNSNHLVSNPTWDIGLQKTGYISEAGRCMVIQTKIEGRSVVMVFLDAKGTMSRAADAGRIRKWLEGFKSHKLAQVPVATS